jgi:hypothetical protein
MAGVGGVAATSLADPYHLFTLRSQTRVIC